MAREVKMIADSSAGSLTRRLGLPGGAGAELPTQTPAGVRARAAAADLRRGLAAG